MITRIVFIFVALLIVATGVWAYHHDQRLEHNAELINLGDPNETVRELLGDPTREGECGSLSAAPQSCTDEYVYRFYFSIFRPQYQVVWFDHTGKVIGEQHVQRP
jgi:hypothetical protein